MTREGAIELITGNTVERTGNHQLILPLKLFNLFQKADQFNQERLRIAFPAEIDVYLEWYIQLDPDEWFKQNGFDTWKRK